MNMNESLVPVERLETLVPLYRDWNEKINVVSRKDIDNLFEHHILHSTVIGQFLAARHPKVYEKWCDPKEGVTIMDVGCGGGFPGVPLAVMFPNVKFTLVDSIRKKTLVASSVAQAAGLENVNVVWDRCENQPEVDYIVSRAVTNLDEFLSWTWKKTRCGILYLKGGDLVEEISTCAAKYHIPMENFEVCPVDAFLPGEFFQEKVILFIRK